MSTANSASATNSNVNLVEQILEQGQRLRNAMVQSILNNDPFNTNIISNKLLKYSTDEDEPNQMHIIDVNDNQDISAKRPLTTEDKHRFIAYLRGEHMSKSDEKKVLETFRAMSNVEICEATERSYSSDNSCNCDTCKAYYKHNLSCDFNHSSSVLCKDKQKVPPLDLHMVTKEVCDNNEFGNMEKIKSGHSKYNLDYLKYVDSLKISVHSLALNQEGNKKVYGSLVDKRVKLPLSISHTYFVEYRIPETIKCNTKSKSKVDSGLDSVNLVRMCSKKLRNEAIYFKQISLHDVSNLHELELKDVNLKFQVSCRTLKQKSSNVLGYAKYTLGSLLDSKYLSSNRELLLMLNSEAPIVLGSLKVSMQLGCGQLYFGKEFIDALNANKENIVSGDDDDKEDHMTVHETKHVNSVASLDSFHKGSDFTDRNYEVVNKNKVVISNKQSTGNTDERKLSAHAKTQRDNIPEPLVGETRSAPTSKAENILSFKEESAKLAKTLNLTYDREVLFGFIYVSEAQYFDDTGNTYVTCQPFSQQDELYSRLVYYSSTPVYNFHQVIPLVYDGDFLSRLRDNYMIFEFREKLQNQDSLIGVCKIPLHQFYIAFRNPVIIKYLGRNKLPVIGCDWWEPVGDPLSGEIRGQAQILVALGTDVQIHNLEIERGFKNEIVTAKSTHSVLSGRKSAAESNKSKSAQRSANTRIGVLYNRKGIRTGNRPFSKPQETHYCSFETDPLSLPSIYRKVDVGVQSSLQMEEPPESIKKQNSNVQAQDALSALLAQLLQQKQKNVHVENATNTETTASDKLPSLSLNVNTIASNSSQIDNADNPNPSAKRTNDLLDSLQNALLTDVGKSGSAYGKPMFKEKDAFKAHVIVETALHLPTRKKHKSKKSRGKNAKQEEILPSTYVTFETIPGKKLETTHVAQKSKSPEWDYRCDVTLPADLLTNSQKRLIFKVWRKSNNSDLQPNIHADMILGFAALDLTVLMAGLPTVAGWFNIMDFSSKCNGQIKISVTPLENIAKFSDQEIICSSRPTTSGVSNTFSNDAAKAVEENKVEEAGELLSRTLKRKFIELDEITQRLRLRLSRVTNDESDTSNDDFADEFENDINTLCVEDDYDMINFERVPEGSGTQGALAALLQIQDSNFIYKDTDEVDLECAKKKTKSHPSASIASVEHSIIETSSLSGVINNRHSDLKLMDTDCILSNNDLTSNEYSASSVLSVQETHCPQTNIDPLDKQLIEGKQKIDSLLEKLSLLTHNDAETFSSRYVSGCSARQDNDIFVSNDILKDIGLETRNIDLDTVINPGLFQYLHTASVKSTPLGTERSDLCLQNSSSSSSFLTQLSECRPAPDGAGNIIDDKNVQKP